MKIGELAQLAGVSVPAIRYYERLGLLKEAPRAISGYRQFGQEAVRRIGFIQRAQALGFSLPEIQQLLDLRQEPGASAADVRARVKAKLASVEAKIHELSRLRDALSDLSNACSRAGGTLASECPILDALAEEPARQQSPPG
ncbi:MAG TPA: heavy metal-responsive transcriptional regulator [Thermoanaerobaculia bacterium]|nr:heavy metal-responsive transcriptional regulator [Thermoanaerobaculia bacterium]